MSTNKEEQGSGFDCPTIGKIIPSGCIMEKTSDGKWIIKEGDANGKEDSKRNN